ncbi:hypothetical protein BST97_04025 [Nonlabens spongiae]|uniref:Secretion system C-terminal sorting domain-containing protein n=1 Tax=Nonlabens spongiae TaxID=331648 RepID=A0A1W6MHY7_9FLAO|nr:T9SS type A sorting domain-containing protein [Nonlabens spongiae]ARN77213.1 hypothetical protein BST97_04025 [Nonlabens spongiae]
MKKYLISVILVSFCFSIKGQINGITSHIWNLHEVNDNGTIYQYADPSSGSTYFGGLENMSGTTMSINYCTGFSVPVSQSGNHSFTMSSNFTMYGSNCNSQAEQVKNDVFINAFVNATRLNGVATFNYRFDRIFHELIITTPDNIEITFFQSTLSNGDGLMQNFETFYNQSTEELVINSDHNSNNFELSIFDISGKRILYRIFSPLPHTTIDLRNVNKGLYIAVIDSSIGKTSFKFVK